jgi:hypothetical protein
MKKISTNKLLSLLIEFALLLGLFPPVMLSVDAATIYRWDHAINVDDAFPYNDVVNGLNIWAYYDEDANRTLSSHSGWLKISGGSNNNLDIKKDSGLFNNEDFSEKIKVDSGTESVTVKFSNSVGVVLSSQTVTATQEGVVASLPATSNVTYVSFESAGEFSITDMTFGNTAPVFTSSSLSTHIGMDTTSFNIASYLGVNDSDSGQTLTWSQYSAPSHGTLEITDATASSGGTSITPGGTIKYRPDENYYGGTDIFSIAVTDGISTDIKTFNIYINYKPEFIDNNNLTLSYRKLT